MSGSIQRCYLQNLIGHPVCDRLHLRPCAAHSGLFRRPDISLQATPNTNSVVTDQAVPEGHKGLHSFLYGEGGAEAHDAELESNQEWLAAGKRLAVQDVITKRLGHGKAGAYAIYSEDGAHQYIGFARSVLSAIKIHRALLGTEKCCFIEARLLPPQTVASRKQLQSDAEAWLAELGTIPVGNSSEKELWEAKVATDIETYEEKKLKMQKAMGEKLEEAAADPSLAQRRQDIISAISQDDWSSVIDAQTQETVAAQSETLPRDAGPAGVVSPFSSSTLADESSGKHELLILNLENVDKTLDEVRPYLMADGGNVEVVEVRDGIVSLRLQGACGTCASSSATMKNGIEKSLKTAYGEALKDVRQVDAIDHTTSVLAVNSHLDMLRPAIKSYGGSVEVKEVSGSQCKLQYSGPPTIQAGVIAAIKSQFPDITDVLVVKETGT